ncbi:hypothetical protein AGLY_011455 [Aphis glycines]|uniref:Uncharacterized protein n=1 Tax=Aphis glycines TaxID=307491 RepID=A0A6G0TC65_APHGL|nr:hypothetical protein AGLY_011455 [Aphis glycines]
MYKTMGQSWSSCARDCNRRELQHTSWPTVRYQSKISKGFVQHEPIEKHNLNQILHSLYPVKSIVFNATTSSEALYIYKTCSFRTNQNLFHDLPEIIIIIVTSFKRWGTYLTSFFELHTPDFLKEFFTNKYSHILCHMLCSGVYGIGSHPMFFETNFMFRKDSCLLVCSLIAFSKVLTHSLSSAADL